MNDRTSFDVATRVLAGDDGTTYDRVAIALHWITALLVLVQFVNAVTWDYWSKPGAKISRASMSRSDCCSRR